MRRLRETTAVAGLAAILAITACWWALALWPLPPTTPTWLVRTRAVCFGTTPSGLPDVSGWMALIGQPALMLGTLLLVWGDVVRAALRSLAGSAAGRVALGGAAAFMLAGTGAAGVRVASAGAAQQLAVAPSSPVPAEYPRLDRPAPPLELIDQHGEPVTLARFRGRPVFVAFAYAHCETVCPLLVREVLRARELAGDVAPVTLVVTLDPWRDTPSRLPAIAERWGLPGDAFVAGGDSALVAATLAHWNVALQRDLRTGEIAHATLVYLVDRDGRVAYAVSGSSGAAALAELARRL
ncbi:MAG TPA: SCO family protein [Gemmatimonadales bacterium]|nr:SCO family protein [Gemmatimonadales bacterium]